MKVGDLVMLDPGLFYEADEAFGLVLEIDGGEDGSWQMVYVMWPNNLNGKQIAWFRYDELKVIND